MAAFLYNVDFNRLWELLETPASLQFPVEIKWDDCPPDDDVAPVASETWLTPIHWAICLKWRHPEASVDITFRDEPQVFQDSPFLKLVRNLHPRHRSWLRLLPEDETRNDNPLGLMIPSRELCRQLRDMLVDEFTSDRQASEHHGINNLILPLILNDESLSPNATKPADHRFALFSMLCALEVIPSTAGNTVPRDNVTINLPAGTLVYLVDDQAKHGWEEWVKSVIGKQASIQRFGHTKFFNVVEGGIRAREDLAKSVVLLDLRLGSDIVRRAVDLLLKDSSGWIAAAIDTSDPAGKQLAADRERIKDVFDPARDAVFAPMRNNEPGIERLRDEVTRSRDEELRHPRCLTLPARLFALLYPRTPVVLFSSTQNEHNLSLLREFPNIITTFNKGTLARAVESDFKQVARSSLLQSIHLAGQLKHISHAADTARKIERQPADGSHPAAHVELYLDESGDEGEPKPIKAGGCVAVFVGEHVEEAVRASHEYNKRFREMHGLPFKFGTQKVTALKGQSFVRAFRTSWQDFGDVAPKCVFRVGLKGWEQRDLMVRLVEVFVALVLPLLKYKCSFNKMTFSIFLPTRTKDIDDVPGGYEYPYRLGVKEDGYGGGRLYLTSDDFASKLAQDAFKYYAPSEWADVHTMLRQALTVCLAYVGGYEARHKKDVRVSAILHHGDKRRDWLRGGKDGRRFTEEQRRAEEQTLEEKGWEPDCRALHYLADLVVGHDCGTGENKPDTYVDVVAWSCSGDLLDDGARNAIRAAQLMNKAEVGDYERLGRALVELAERKEPAPTVPAQDSLRQLALSNLRRLAGDSWEKVVAAAFRSRKMGQLG
jgi:hypothetical protein